MNPSEEDSIADWLARDGWKESNCVRVDGCDRIWLKYFSNEPKCKCNAPQPLQVGCGMWRFPDNVGLQITLSGQPEDVCEWVKLQAYSIDRVEDVPRHVERLLRAWRAIAGDSQCQ